MTAIPLTGRSLVHTPCGQASQAGLFNYRRKIARKMFKKDDILNFLCQNVSNTSDQPTAKVIPTGNDGNIFNGL